jgi:hypothetical protein
MNTDFIILDAARVGREMEEALTLHPAHDCLYTGKDKENLGGVAPWLFDLREPDQLRNWFAEKGWGKSWGIGFASKASFEDCRDHFRKFLLVTTEAGFLAERRCPLTGDHSLHRK